MQQCGQEKTLEHRVVVTGMGCVCAAGTSPAMALASLRGQSCGKTGQTCQTDQRTLTPSSVLGAEAMPYPFFAAPEELFPGGRAFSAMDTLHLAEFAAKAALAEAKLPAESLAHMPIMAGTTAGSALHFLHSYALSRDKDAKTPPPVAPHAVVSDKDAYFQANIALNLCEESQGPRLTVANACTSGADAIGLGLDAIAQGAPCVLCGGADALSIVPHTGFARLMIYDDAPCRPFDGSRKGLNLGEGAAFLVLENYAHALARGAKILGFVLGYGAATDAHHFTAPHPEGRGLRAAIDKAMHEAECTWQDVAFVNAHGTATPENDKVEGSVLKDLTAAHATPVWASKGGTGHTLGAAGALEALLCLEALRQGIVPKSLGFGTADPAIGLTPTQVDSPVNGACAVSTSLGFGGGNAAVVLGSADYFTQRGA